MFGMLEREGGEVGFRERASEVGLYERQGESKIAKTDLWLVRNVRERGR